MDLIKDLFKGDKVIWIIFLFLCLISIVEVFSAASTLTYKSGDHWGPITQHSVILMVGACIVVLVHNIPCKWFRVLPFFLLPISAVLLVFVMGMGIITGDRVNGAARWMTFFGIQFQPSELAKMAVIIVTAFILSKFQEEDGANPKAFKYIMWITGIVFILIAPENGSTAMLLFGVVFLMMIIGRVPWKQLLKLISIVGVIAVIFIGMIMVTPAKQYRDIPMMHRVETWQNRIKGFFEDKEAVPPNMILTRMPRLPMPISPLPPAISLVKCRATVSSEISFRKHFPILFLLSSSKSLGCWEAALLSYSTFGC